MTEQEDVEREEGERVSHPEKRAKISGGENFLNTSLPFSSNYLPPPFICFLCIRLILPTLFPSSCLMLNPASALLVFQKYLFLFVASFFPINATLNLLHHNPHPPFPVSVPSIALCGSKLREVFNPAFERSAREKRRRGTAILSLFFQLCRSSAALTHPLQSCSFLLFSSPFFFSLICLGFLFFFFFFLACGIALALPGTGRRVKYPSPVYFWGENSPSASPVFIALFLHRILHFSPLLLFNLSVSHPSPCLSHGRACVLKVMLRGDFQGCKTVVIKDLYSLDSAVCRLVCTICTSSNYLCCRWSK